MLERYFQEELDYLHQTGEEFSAAFPKMVKYLSSRATDPDVERMLEGFAFLSAQLRHKIDDQLPEVTETLLNLFWPGFLRVIPSTTILRLDTPKGAISARQKVEKGMEVESTAIGGTSCRFRTAYDLDVFPLLVTKIDHESSKATSTIRLHIKTQNGEKLQDIGLRNLRFYLGGSDYSAQTLNLYLQRYLSAVKLRSVVNKAEITLPPGALKPAGLHPDEELLPTPRNGFVGYRLIQEYFALPHKFYFLELQNLPINSLPEETTEFELIFELNRPIPPDTRLSNDSFQLNCVPALNLFDHDADPILLDGKRSEYKVTPTQVIDSEIDIFEITEVTGWMPDSHNTNGVTHQYDRFESFMHEVERVGHRKKIYYREKLRQSIAGKRVNHYLTFMREDELFAIKKGETISIRLICTNGRLPAELGVGDVCIPTGATPSFVMPTNITRPTQPIYPVLDGTLQWQLISALSLNYLSLQNLEALRTILFAFDLGAKVDRQKERAALNRLQGIESLSTQTTDRFFRGMPVRGMLSTMRMRESAFGSEGEMFMFSSVLSEFFALYATVNSFHELEVQGIETGEVYRWKPNIGQQPLI